MHPDVRAIVADLSQEEIDGLSAVIADAADAHGIQELTPEMIEGTILGAARNDHWTVDGLSEHLGYVATYGEPYQPPEQQHEHYQPAHEQEPHMDEQLRLQQQADQAAQDAHDLEQRLGRRMTSHEADALAQAQHAQLVRGGQMDVDQAAQTAGIRSWGEMSPREISATMAQRVRDQNPDNRELEVPMAPSGEMAGSGWAPDWGNMSQRDINQYLTARASGAEISDVEFDDGGEPE